MTRRQSRAVIFFLFCMLCVILSILLVFFLATLYQGRQEAVISSQSSMERAVIFERKDCVAWPVYVAGKGVFGGS